MEGNLLKSRGSTCHPYDEYTSDIDLHYPTTLPSDIDDIDAGIVVHIHQSVSQEQVHQ